MIRKYCKEGVNAIAVNVMKISTDANSQNLRESTKNTQRISTPKNNIKHAINTVLNKEAGTLEECRHLIKGKDTAKYIKEIEKIWTHKHKHNFLSPPQFHSNRSQTNITPSGGGILPNERRFIQNLMDSGR